MQRPFTNQFVNPLGSVMVVLRQRGKIERDIALRGAKAGLLHRESGHQPSNELIIF